MVPPAASGESCSDCRRGPGDGSGNRSVGSTSRSSSVGLSRSYHPFHFLLNVYRIGFFLLLLFLLFHSTAAAEIFDPPKAGTLKSAAVNLRSGPSLSDPVTGRIEGKDTPVTVLEQRENWVKIRVGQKEGWVFQALVSIAEADAEPAQPAGKKAASPPAAAPAPETAAPEKAAAPPLAVGKTSGDQVRVRSGPSLSDDVVAYIEGKGSRVEILERSGDWLRIRHDGTEGWVFSSLVAVSGAAAVSGAPEAPEAPSPPSAEEAPPAVEPPQPPAARVEPGREEDVAVLIREIAFSGNTVIDTDTLLAVAEDYRGRELTLEEMSELVDRITITYQERGYILARAFLPKQDIGDGVLQIAVMEGNIGKIEVAGKTHYGDKLVKKYFEAQLKDGVVKESALEKGLLLTNELPDLKTNVVLRRGEEAGDVDVVVNTEDESRMTLGLEVGFDYNNFGSELTSKNRFGTTVRIVDHEWGTITDLRAVLGNHIKESFLGAVDFSLPVGSYGTRASVGYLYGNYIVGQNFADLGLDGFTRIFGLKASHPAIKERNRNLDFTLGWDNKYTKNFILDQERSIDETNVVYGALSFDNLDRFLGKNIFNLSLSFGEVVRDDQIATSRGEEDLHYERVNASYARVQKLFGYTNLFFRAAGQYSNDRLIPIEQFVLGGYGTVRGYDPALLLGDMGYTLTAELMFAPPYIADTTLYGSRLAELLQLAVFYDEGRAYINEEVPGSGELPSENLAGYGAGLRIFYKDRFYFKYDIGFPLLRIGGKDQMFHYVQVGYQLF